MSFGLVCGVGPPGQKLVPGQNYRVDRMAETGLYEDGKRGIRRVIDPHLRVKDAELDGVDAEVIFGILGAATRLGDTRPRARCSGSTTTGSWISAVTTRSGTSAWRACRTGDIDGRGQGGPPRRQDGAAGLELSCSWDMEPMWHPSGSRCGRR
jgi:hypothetical protein